MAFYIASKLSTVLSLRSAGQDPVNHLKFVCGIERCFYPSCGAHLADLALSWNAQRIAAV